MIYQLYQAYFDAVAPLRAAARATTAVLNLPMYGMFDQGLIRSAAAAHELVARAGLRHERPAFGIDALEEPVLRLPFATLLHFKKEDATPQPRVLLVAPMSGHFATLLRGTIQTMLPEHDVYITDWHNARDVDTDDGRFDVDDYIDYIIRFLETIGPEAHVVAVCQASVPVLAAVAVMAEAGNSAIPRSMTLMAGPVDTRSNPTKVNELALSRSMSWFERMIGIVPFRYRGATRRVYPGFVQLTAFMSMNIERHLKAHRDLYDHIASGNEEKAQAIRAFYDEYFAVTDLPAEFYLQTVSSIFQEHALPLGKFEWRGRRVDPRAINRTALLTIEGERDDVCGLGQTLAAHDLCSSLRQYRKRHHMQAGVGHYGVFSGARWNNQIYPVLKNAILSSA
ncbi:MAG TPA: polyhydroxyalkanoate depolymerase [Candidatus Binatia bacterium]|nr:polyhydroxyalkanoate depolymerase [Candidatus Binatia bacterium]